MHRVDIERLSTKLVTTQAHKPMTLSEMARVDIIARVATMSSMNKQTNKRKQIL